MLTSKQGTKIGQNRVMHSKPDNKRVQKEHVAKGDGWKLRCLWRNHMHREDNGKMNVTLLVGESKNEQLHVALQPNAHTHTHRRDVVLGQQHITGNLGGCIAGGVRRADTEAGAGAGEQPQASALRPSF